MMRMPFGRFRRQEVAALPDEYLRWLSGVARQPLRSVVKNEIARRAGGGLQHISEILPEVVGEGAGNPAGVSGVWTKAQ
jgi:hypothetical protein